MASTYPIIKENPIKSNQKTATICTVEPWFSDTFGLSENCH